MVQMNRASDSGRIRSALAAAAFHLVLGYALVTGLGVDLKGAVSDELKIFDVPQEPPPLPIEEPAPAQKAAEADEGAASPPNLKAKASPVVAPPPVIPLEVPPPIVAAPTPKLGNETSAGASTVAGPGTGSGGLGTGTGSGGAGNGAGGGGVRARLVRGQLSGADYPRAARRAGIGGVVLTRYDIGPDGRVHRCTVTGSSGNAQLDEATCRLVKRRYRYQPARDANGEAVWDAIVDRHNWWTQPRERREIFDRPAHDEAGFRY